MLKRHRLLFSSGDYTIFALFLMIVLLSTVPALSTLINGYLVFMIVVACYLWITLSSKRALHLLLPMLIATVALGVISYYTPVLNLTPKEMFLTVYNLFYFLLPLFMVHYLIIREKYAMLTTLSLIGLLAFMVSMVTTLIVLQKFPGAARLSATGDFGVNDAYAKQNMGGYAWIYSAVITVPLWLYFFRKNSKAFLVSSAILLLLLAVILKSQYTMAIMLFVLGSCFGILQHFRYRTTIILSISTLAVLIIIFSGPALADTFRWLASVTGSEIVATKLLNLADFFQYGMIEGDIAGRYEVYMSSWRMFVANPIVGTWGLPDRPLAGGHSSILDAFATSGIVGGGVLCFILWLYYKNILCMFKRHAIYPSLIGAFMVFLVISSINTSFSHVIGMMIFFFIPGVALLDSSVYPLTARSASLARTHPVSGIMRHASVRGCTGERT